MRPTVLRRSVSAVRRVIARLMSFGRIVRARICFEGVQIAWSATLGRGVTLSSTDGGVLKIGARTIISDYCEIVSTGLLTIGADCFIGRGAILVAKAGIEVRRGALIAEYVTIRDQDHQINGAAKIPEAGFVSRPIVVGEGAWLGAKATVLRGVTIGAGAVVAAHSVVKTDVSALSVVAGAPAVRVRSRQIADAHEVEIS